MTITETTETTGAPPSWMDPDADRQAAEAVASLIGPPQSAPVGNIEPHEIIRRIGQPVVQRDDRYICPVCALSFEHAQSLGPHFRLHWQEAGVNYHDIPNVQSTRAKCPECDVLYMRHSLSGHLKTRHGYENGRANGVARTMGFDLDAYLDPPPPPAAVVTSEPKAKKVKNPKVGYEERQMQYVACPFDECGAVHKRKYMYRHLEGVHEVSRSDSRDQTRALPVSRLKHSVQGKMSSPGRPRAIKPTDALAVIEQPNGVTPPASTAPLFEGVTSAFDFTSISATDIAIGVVQSQLNGTMPTAILPDVIVYVDHTRTLIDQLRATRS